MNEFIFKDDIETQAWIKFAAAFVAHGEGPHNASLLADTLLDLFRRHRNYEEKEETR